MAILRRRYGAGPSSGTTKPGTSITSRYPLPTICFSKVARRMHRVAKRSRGAASPADRHCYRADFAVSSTGYHLVAIDPDFVEENTQWTNQKLITDPAFAARCS